MKKQIKEKVKKEIKISKEKKFSKKRALIIFAVVMFLIIFLMFIWGGIMHKKTGLSPKDFGGQIIEE